MGGCERQQTSRLTFESGTGLALTEYAINVPWGTANVLLATELNLHTSLGWRWCYYLGLIFAVISLVGTLLFYWPPARPQHDHDKTRWQEVMELDFIGLILYTAGLVTLLVGLTWAGQAGHPWKSASVIVPIVVGFIGLAACFLYDFYLAKRPLFPFEVFRQVRDFTVLLGIVFVAGKTSNDIPLGDCFEMLTVYRCDFLLDVGASSSRILICLHERSHADWLYCASQWLCAGKPLTPSESGHAKSK